MRRVLVLGLPGAGKSTFARELAERWKTPHVEVDRLFWREDGSECPRDSLRKTVEEKLAAPSWVVEGHFTKIGDLVLSRANLIVWLDYSLPRVLFRLARREFPKYEKVAWFLNHHGASTRAFAEAVSGVTSPVWRFLSPAEARAFLESSATLPGC